MPKIFGCLKVKLLILLYVYTQKIKYNELRQVERAFIIIKRDKSYDAKFRFQSSNTIHENKLENKTKLKRYNNLLKRRFKKIKRRFKKLKRRFI